jgi:hypothetical protein
MARTYNVSSTQEAKKVILKIIMAEVRKIAGNRPVKINVKDDKDDI